MGGWPAICGSSRLTRSIPLWKASPTLYKRLITERNARWADQLRRRLKGRGVVIVIVGMGHLIGPQGVPARLRAMGVAVDGP